MCAMCSARVMSELIRRLCEQTQWLHESLWVWLHLVNCWQKSLSSTSKLLNKLCSRYL